jgi:hypothetical protein
MEPQICVVKYIYTTFTNVRTFLFTPSQQTQKSKGAVMYAQYSVVTMENCYFYDTSSVRITKEEK